MWEEPFNEASANAYFREQLAESQMNIIENAEKALDKLTEAFKNFRFNTKEDDK